MFRAIFLTFHGEYKGGEPVDHHDEDNHFHGDPAHPHESAWVMTLPLLILAVPAIAAGWLNIDGGFINGWFGHFINGALPVVPEEKSGFAWGVAISSTALALAGIGFAYVVYYKEWLSAKSLRASFAPLAIVFENKYYLDKLYENVFAVHIFQNGWNRLLELNDKYVVDGAVNGSGILVREISSRARSLQTGQLQSYGLGLAAGVIILVVAVFAANPL
jgi:NADH-quinone oxidoreductase subunit L